MHYGNAAHDADLSYLGIKQTGLVGWNLHPSELVEETLLNQQGILTNTGALAIETGEFTGRSPKDRFIVRDSITEKDVWWGDVNKPFDPAKFDALYNRVMAYLSNRDLYVRDSRVCADTRYSLNVRSVTEYAWSNLFVDNMFIRLTAEERANFTPDWHVICAPGFQADPQIDGTRQHNFAILNFTRKVILIGGTGYTGEMKKGIFSALNFILPVEKNVLSMHCSANVGESGDVAVFFGLSGTGKTTLSSDPQRKLIGDDEHGWSDHGVFNFEGGCYAKCINLSKDREPQIFNAIKFGALLENIVFKDDSSEVDYDDASTTENTRVSYPIHHIEGAVEPSVGGIPKHIFFLTCDAFGVLPPISKLSRAQAMYHFMSGYTAKVAGTEADVTEPTVAFSACFGAPFMPLHPARYAEMLAERMDKTNAQVWLINTGWTGGPYGVGSRMRLRYTRAMIRAAMEGKLNEIETVTDPIFGVEIPTSCPDVPNEVLLPRKTWKDQNAYEAKANELAKRFLDNFRKFEEGATPEILNAAPKAGVGVSS